MHACTDARTHRHDYFTFTSLLLHFCFTSTLPLLHFTLRSHRQTNVPTRRHTDVQMYGRMAILAYGSPIRTYAHTNSHTYGRTDVQTLLLHFTSLSTYFHVTSDIQKSKHEDTQTHRRTELRTYGRMDIQIYGSMDVWTYGHMAGQTDIRTHARTELLAYRQSFCPLTSLLLHC